MKVFSTWGMIETDDLSHYMIYKSGDTNKIKFIFRSGAEIIWKYTEPDMQILVEKINIACREPLKDVELSD